MKVEQYLGKMTAIIEFKFPGLCWTVTIGGRRACSRCWSSINLSGPQASLAISTTGEQHAKLRCHLCRLENSFTLRGPGKGRWLLNIKELGSLVHDYCSLGRGGGLGRLNKTNAHVPILPIPPPLNHVQLWFQLINFICTLSSLPIPHAIIKFN